MKCKRCKRKLKSKKSIKIGYGQMCFRKHKIERLEGYFKEWYLQISGDGYGLYGGPFYLW